MLSNKNDKPIGKVLTFDPIKNSLDFLDYTEKSLHPEYDKLYKITTKRGYSIKVTNDHSLATCGKDTFIESLKPENALNKFVPIIHKINIDASQEEKEIAEAWFNDYHPDIYPELLFLDLVELAGYLESLFNNKDHSYTCSFEAAKYVLLLLLARLGIAVEKIDGLTIYINEKSERLIPNFGKLETVTTVSLTNPANPFLNIDSLTWDEVVSVEEVEKEAITYDFSVPAFPLFIGNMILVYDTMMVHTPMTEEARQEVLDKMLPSKNLFFPLTLKPAMLPQQEHIMGLFYASRDIPNYMKSNVKAPDVVDMDKLLQDIKMGAIKPNAPVKYQGHLTTAGMAVILSNLPMHLRKYDQVWDKKYLTRILDVIGKQTPEKYAYIAQLIKELGALYGYKLQVTYKMSDFDLQKLKKMRDAYFKKTDKELAKIEANTSLSAKEKETASVAALRKAQAFTNELTSQQRDNTFAQIWYTGAKGNIGNVTQIIGSPTIVSDPKDRVIPQLIRHSYLEGLTPQEYFVSSYGTRKGTVGAKLSVAPAGGLTKEILGNTVEVVVSCKDCRTTRGITLPVDSEEDVMYRVEAGTNKFIDANYYEQLKRQHKQNIVVRSPSTCEAREGICQYCYGFNERMKFPDIGENVGVTAAHAVTEPLTQLGLSSKHTAGTAAGEGVGFDTVKAFFNMSSKFSGAAVITEVPGTITKIEKAPTGGTNIFVNKKKYYAPPNRNPKVKVGDTVVAGDPLTDGILNFSKIVPYKGIEEGRNEFINNAYSIYEGTGSIHSVKKNFEVLSRGIINYVEIKDPMDWDEYIIGDVVDYNRLMADIRQHPEKKPPVYAPYQKGTNKMPTFKSDWLTNFGFKYLKDRLLNNAATFSQSPKHQFNPIGPYARGAGFGKGEGGKY